MKFALAIALGLFAATSFAAEAPKADAKKEEKKVEKKAEAKAPAAAPAAAPAKKEEAKK